MAVWGFCVRRRTSKDSRTHDGTTRNFDGFIDFYFLMVYIQNTWEIKKKTKYVHFVWSCSSSYHVGIYKKRRLIFSFSPHTQKVRFIFLKTNHFIFFIKSPMYFCFCIYPFLFLNVCVCVIIVFLVLTGFDWPKHSPPPLLFGCMYKPIRNTSCVMCPAARSTTKQRDRVGETYGTICFISSAASI